MTLSRAKELLAGQPVCVSYVARGTPVSDASGCPQLDEEGERLVEWRRVWVIRSDEPGSVGRFLGEVEELPGEDEGDLEVRFSSRVAELVGGP